MTETLIVIAMIGVAGAYLLRKAWLRVQRARSGTCGGCSSCGTKPQAEATHSRHASLTVSGKKL